MRWTKNWGTVSSGASKHTSYENIWVINNGVFHKTNNNYCGDCFFNFTYNEHSS